MRASMAISLRTSRASAAGTQSDLNLSLTPFQGLDEGIEGGGVGVAGGGFAEELEGGEAVLGVAGGEELEEGLVDDAAEGEVVEVGAGVGEAGGGPVDGVGLGGGPIEGAELGVEGGLEGGGGEGVEIGRAHV